MDDKIPFSQECPNCHKVWYLGFSGFDQGKMLIAYRCPDCGNESADCVPDVDDILPRFFAWFYEHGEITWHLGPQLAGVSGENRIFYGFRDFAEWYTADILEDIHIDPSMDMIETVISETERVYSYRSVYGPIHERLTVTINEQNQYAAKVERVS